MDNKIVKKYRNTDTEELIKIAFINKNDYRTEAVEMATKELRLRGITSESEIVLQHTAPLETKSKVIIFMCGIIPLTFLIAICFIILRKNKRGIIKTKESWKWLWIGFGTMWLFISIPHILFTIIK